MGAAQNYILRGGRKTRNPLGIRKPQVYNHAKLEYDNGMNRKRGAKTASNSPSTYTGGITIKSPQELEAMAKAGAIVGSALTLLKRSVEPGITTRELDQIAYQEIISHGAKPAFKGYRGFPATICASVNEEIVHGIPGRRVLHEGDIIKMDCGATIDGFIGDAAVSRGRRPGQPGSP